MLVGCDPTVEDANRLIDYAPFLEDASRLVGCAPTVKDANRLMGLGLPIHQSMEWSFRSTFQLLRSKLKSLPLSVSYRNLPTVCLVR